MTRSLHAFFFLSLLLITCLPAGPVQAQRSEGGVPLSFSLALAPDPTGTIQVTPPAREKLDAEDRQSPVPFRFSVNMPVSVDIHTDGNWIRTGSGDNVWRVRIEGRGAEALILYFDRFHLPEGGRLFVYNPGRTNLLGAFTGANNNRMSTFATGLLAGDQVEVEYDAPSGVQAPELRISEVGYAYRGVAGPSGTLNGFKGSGDCQVNVNCTEGNGWQIQKRGVTRIAVKRGGGSVWCSGSLIDNARHDGTPYILTADHCGALSTETDLSQWIFYFNYEATACPVPDQEPALTSLTGASLVAHGGNMGYNGSDFYMVRLNDSIPPSFNPYFNGWSRETIPASPSGVCIHHPMGDIKKISTYTQPVDSAHWAGGIHFSHWRVGWSETNNGHGTTEGGSSGSPLFSNEGLIIGTLTGGESSCDSVKLNSPDYFGMFSYHWDRNGTDSASILKCWLDPDNTGVMKLKGWATSAPEEPFAGKVSVYPNPAGDYLKLRLPENATGTLRMKLMDVLGNCIVTANLEVSHGMEQEISLAGIRPGIYLLELGDGKSHAVRKVIRQ
ncbi:MAG TPA: T9SS type A sorting domain-containing protein [Bacteroidales bacterium]|nr:T9SS type A sorting domain-containing protein [Bacteroidales bacterium]